MKVSSTLLMRVSSGEAVRVCVCVQSVSLQADRSGDKSDGGNGACVLSRTVDSASQKMGHLLENYSRRGSFVSFSLVLVFKTVFCFALW